MAAFEPFTHRTAPWGPVYQEVLTQLGLQHLESADAQALVMLLVLSSESQGWLPTRVRLALQMGLTMVQLQALLLRLSPYLTPAKMLAPAVKHLHEEFNDA